MRHEKSIGLALALAFVVPVSGCAPDTQGESAIEYRGGEAVALQEQENGFVDEGPEHHLIYRPAEVEWQDAPPSLEPGGQVAVLEGDPSAAEVFTMRIRMPDGYFISPHSHPNVERVTVVSGTFLLGSSEEMDRGATERLEQGSYTSLPPRTTHFAIAEGETVIQLTSVGPWVIDYVNPEDDPRRREQ